MRRLTLLLSLLVIATTTLLANKPLDLKVMTFNIRYATHHDGENSWDNRKEAVMKLLKSERCDLIGTQEVLHNQFEDIANTLPQYNAVGVGREDGKTKGEYAAIYYLKERFDELESGNFWLSETPEKIGVKGWDAACERVATWVRLQERETKREFLFINTHLDHMGQMARKKGIELVLERAHLYAKGNPIILTGDLNASPHSEVIKYVTEGENKLYDSRYMAEVMEGTSWSFHDFDRAPIERRQLIDYIFITKPLRVKSHSVLPMRLDGQLVSDHNPIVAEITL